VRILAQFVFSLPGLILYIMQRRRRSFTSVINFQRPRIAGHTVNDAERAGVGEGWKEKINIVSSSAHEKRHVAWLMRAPQPATRLIILSPWRPTTCHLSETAFQSTSDYTRRTYTFAHETDILFIDETFVSLHTFSSSFSELTYTTCFCDDALNWFTYIDPCAIILFITVEKCFKHFKTLLKCN